MSKCSMSHVYITGAVLLIALNGLKAQTTPIENVAVRKRCNMSSTYLENMAANSCDCAVNNKTSAVFITGNCYTNGNCIHTAEGDPTPTWSVDLGREYSIQNITIIARSTRKYRMRNVKVSLDGFAVYTFPLNKDPEYTTNLMPTTGRLIGRGRYVQLTRQQAYSMGQAVDFGDYGNVFLNFCEVQVWVTDTNDCDSNPCDNGGSCTDGVASYTCTCRKGFTGTHCETDINECASSPCRHKGACIDMIDSYSCSCIGGYTGFWCEQELDECLSNPCVNGGSCTDGFDSYTCICVEGYSGSNCNINIDDCSPKPCLHGWCTDLIGQFSCTCDDGYNGTLCDVALPQSSFGESTFPMYAVGAGIGGVVLVILLVVVISLLVIRYRKKYIPKKSVDGGSSLESRKTSQDIDGSGSVKDTAYLYGNLQYDADNASHTSSTKQTIIYTPPGTRRDLMEPKPNSRVSKSHVIATTPAITESVYANADPSICKNQTEDKPTVARAESEDELFVEDIDDVYNGSLYACYNSNQKTVSLLDDFQNWLLDRISEPEIMQNEFERFPKGMLHSHTVGLDSTNLKKNRFQQLCAYDKNRVILTRTENDLDTDYINASWVKGLDNEKSYIAAQGPRVNTVSDLWWMVWQENVTQIVMLTNLQEDGKAKCVEYWPASGKTSKFGRVVVISKDVEERSDFIVRTFVIYSKEQKAGERLVYQYHYVVWPDHCVPSASSLAQFWNYVTARATTSAPPVIHCSAGVGRTGTYIALDLIMGRKSRGLEVSISDVVMELREQRSIMVQTLVQYKFLHEVVLEAYTSRNSGLTAEELSLKFPTNIDVNTPDMAMDDEYKLLTEIKQWAEPRHQTAQLEENWDKNRDQGVLPDDDHIAYLQIHFRGRNQYINAVYLSSFRRRRGLLLTQLPLPHTLVDMWRLVEGCDVTTILSFGAKDDDKTVQNFCRYWPRLPDEKLTIGPYVLMANSFKRENINLTNYCVKMQSEDITRSVNIIHYTDWSGEVPGNISDVIYLVNLVSAASEDSQAPVIIQCLDGATRSGLFCIMHDVACHLAKDDEVSIFSIVRHVQSVRREAVTSEKQYRYLYKLAQEINSTKNVYANV